MKRSDALELIENILISDAVVDAKTAQYVSETLLGTLEKAGMCLVTDDGNSLRSLDWEPEDEVKCGAV